MHHHLYDDGAMDPVGDILPADADVLGYLKENLDDARAEMEAHAGDAVVITSEVERVLASTAFIFTVTSLASRHRVGVIACGEACAFLPAAERGSASGRLGEVGA